MPETILSKEETKLHALIEAGKGFLFPLSERAIIFEAMELYASQQSAGLRWRKASDPPEKDGGIIIRNKIKETTGVGYYESAQEEKESIFDEGDEWLDESASPEAVDDKLRLHALEFDSWRSENFNQKMPNGYESKVIDENVNYQRRYTRHELYQIFLKSKQSDEKV